MCAESMTGLQIKSKCSTNTWKYWPDISKSCSAERESKQFSLYVVKGNFSCRMAMSSHNGDSYPGACNESVKCDKLQKTSLLISREMPR